VLPGPLPSAGYRPGGDPNRVRDARPEKDPEHQPIDPRQPPVELDRLGDAETRAAKAAALFRPRLRRW
jgi:hypothetical protein